MPQERGELKLTIPSCSGLNLPHPFGDSAARGHHYASDAVVHVMYQHPSSEVSVR